MKYSLWIFTLVGLCWGVQLSAQETVTDIEGNVYHTVTIGTQVWMVENLKTTQYRNGNPITNVTGDVPWAALSDGAYCHYKNLSSNSATYGLLYNWYAVKTGDLAPTGWHVPSDAEWTTLATFLGGESVAGGKLKEAGSSHWESPNKGADNSSGFTALPGGNRNNGSTFYDIKSYGDFWSSTEDNAGNAWNRGLRFNASNLYRRSYRKTSGFSVRCVKD